VRLGKEVSAGSIAEGAPDAVVLATGAVPFIPDIPGIEGDNIILAEEVLAGHKEVGEEVVIIGGEQVACDTALYLAEKGKRVTMCRRGLLVAEKTFPLLFRHLLHPLLEKLTARGVTMLTGVQQYEQISGKGLDIIDRDGNRRTLEADTIILATGYRRRNDLACELEGKVTALYSVGDCVEPRMIKEAISEGYGTALVL
jgi:pyruvate/2-oxoglutarate dehydrogenase complex dihydrolipoamide dehydrogenase (E3) component